MPLLVNAKEIFLRAVENGCSDVHIKPGSPPKMRLNESLVAVPGYEDRILDDEQTRLIVYETMSPTDHSRFNHNGYEHDYAFDLEGVGRFRMNAYTTIGRTAAVGRLLKDKPDTLTELGVSAAVGRLAALKSGLIIVSGATGSGKSTTMAGVIDFINKGRAVQIISIEDPIEVVHSDALASISQREVGVDVADYQSALKAALREDPDVILIGEVRDLDTMKTALTAAETGHLVVTTLHTKDTPETINRILTMFPQAEREDTRRALASSLRGVVGQRLVPKLEGGRVVVNEILINTAEVTDAILESADTRTLKAIIESNTLNGMHSFEQNFLQLVKSGVIDLATAKANSVDPGYYDRIGEAHEEEDKLEVPQVSTPRPLPRLSKQPAQEIIRVGGKALPEARPARFADKPRRVTA